MNFLLLHTAIPNERVFMFARLLADQTNRQLLVEDAIPDDLEQYAEDHGIDILFIFCRNRRRELQQWLDRCRLLRLPYLFFTDTMLHIYPLKSVLSPVTLLEEEVHKAETFTHLARFTGCRITLLRANDYGSRAEHNTEKILTALAQFDLNVSVVKAGKDSFSVAREAAERQNEWQADLLVVTASRDYGLDDIFFGPQERKVIQHSLCPVLLLNPRGDLFSLCD